jgi:hypothetical protein
MYGGFQTVHMSISKEYDEITEGVVFLEPILLAESDQWPDTRRRLLRSVQHKVLLHLFDAMP